MSTAQILQSIRRFMSVRKVILRIRSVIYAHMCRKIFSRAITFMTATAIFRYGQVRANGDLQAWGFHLSVLPYALPI